MNYIIYVSKLRFDFVASPDPIVGEHFYFFYLVVPSWIFATLYRILRHLHACHRAQAD